MPKNVYRSIEAIFLFMILISCLGLIFTAFTSALTLCPQEIPLSLKKLLTGSNRSNNFTKDFTADQIRDFTGVARISTVRKICVAGHDTGDDSKNLMKFYFL